MKTFVLAGVVLVVVAAGAFGARRLMEPDPSMFDKQRWVAEAKAKPEENKRSQMTKDLETRLRPGMSESDIVELMGPPDSRRADRFVYEMGTPGLFASDYFIYVIQFDGDRKVVRYFSQK